MFFEKRSKITLDSYPGITFYPFHQLKKENGGTEPYIKTVVSGSYNFDFFKVKGEVFAIKPSSKSDLTKLLCAKVENPVTIDSAQGSITGNCAKGIKADFVRMCSVLSQETSSKEEFFRRLIHK